MYLILSCRDTFDHVLKASCAISATSSNSYFVDIGTWATVWSVAGFFISKISFDLDNTH